MGRLLLPTDNDDDDDDGTLPSVGRESMPPTEGRSCSDESVSIDASCMDLVNLDDNVIGRFVWTASLPLLKVNIFRPGRIVDIAGRRGRSTIHAAATALAIPQPSAVIIHNTNRHGNQRNRNTAMLEGGFGIGCGLTWDDNPSSLRFPPSGRRRKLSYQSVQLLWTSRHRLH